MKLLSNLTTRSKLLVGFVIILLAIIAMLTESYINVIGVETSQEELNKSYNVVISLTQLRSDENRLRALMLEYLYSNDKEISENVKKQIQERMSEANDRQKDIDQSLSDKLEIQGQFRDIMQSMELFRENREKQIKMVADGKIKDAQDFSVNVQNALYQNIRLGLLDVESKINDHTKRIADTIVNDMHHMLYFLIGSGLIIMVIATYFIYNMIRLLRKISMEIRNGVSILGTSAAEILTTVTEVSTGATETATAVSETTTTIEEIRQTALIATQRAQVVLEIANRSAGAAENGKDSVVQTIDGMKRIDQQMNMIAESVVKLSEQSRSIGEITSSVNDIADQSNLLAVNAAIEAAKAGEHGRGFAVVAQEIRSLSEQSKQATSQVKVILNDIQKAVNQAVIATEQGSKAVESGNKLALKSGEIIDQLAESVDEAAQAVIQISNSSQQQMAGMDQIVPAMENIKQASEQNASGIRQTQMAAQNLNELGLNLKNVVEKYNI